MAQLPAARCHCITRTANRQLLPRHRPFQASQAALQHRVLSAGLTRRGTPTLKTWQPQLFMQSRQALDMPLFPKVMVIMRQTLKAAATWQILKAAGPRWIPKEGPTRPKLRQMHTRVTQGVMATPWILKGQLPWVLVMAAGMLLLTRRLKLRRGLLRTQLLRSLHKSTRCVYSRYCPHL